MPRALRRRLSVVPVGTVDEMVAHALAGGVRPMPVAEVR